MQFSLAKESSEQKAKPELAESMLVWMVRLLHIAQYATCSLSGNKLYPIAWDVVEALEINGLKVRSISCDGVSANRKF